MKRIWTCSLFFALLGLGIAGCRPAAAVLSAAALEDTPVPIAAYPSPLSELTDSDTLQPVTVYNITLELEVDDLQAAVSEAVRLNAACGGRLVTSQRWTEEGREVVFLEFAVPDDQSARLHSALLKLGRKTSGNFATYSRDCLGCLPYAHISLYLRHSPGLVSPYLSEGWHPLRTFRAAFRVFTRIFGFLADILIWLAVVGGPFVLIAWGITALARHLRKSNPASQPDHPGENTPQEKPS